MKACYQISHANSSLLKQICCVLRFSKLKSLQLCRIVKQAVVFSGAKEGTLFNEQETLSAFLTEWMFKYDSK